MARINPTLIFVEKEVAAAVRLEPAIVLVCLAFASWVIYKLFLRDVLPERHRRMKELFRNLLNHVLIGLTLFGLYEAFLVTKESHYLLSRLLPYTGFLAVVWGSIVLIKTLRIMAFEYLFLGSMRVGVPVLIVNIFTLILSLFVFGWMLSTIFGVNLTPLLATSAVLSIVLGLALQETLGNLFAGIALQIDKAFEIGDWIELKHGGDKIVGQVQEISWRATVLLAVTDESITIPNRNLAQGHILNFSGDDRPFIRSHVFRIPFAADLELAKSALVSAAIASRGVLTTPRPAVIATETTESWITVKLLYWISDYGQQFGIADEVISRSLESLRAAGVRVAGPRLILDRSPSADNAKKAL